MRCAIPLSGFLYFVACRILRSHPVFSAFCSRMPSRRKITAITVERRKSTT
jgi:hypothetical protein